MLAALPNPILSVTPEGVRELDGREALSGLWTLFSKCKESIENGRRLENISWRLWYRDMLVSASVQCDEANREAANLPVEDECFSEKTYRPPTPMETVLPPPSDQDPSTQLTVSPSLYSGSPHSITQLAISPSMPHRHQSHSDSLRRPRRPLAVGQIICEIANVHPTPATSPSFLPLSMSPSYSGVTRVPRPEHLAPLPASLSRSDLGGSNVYFSGSALLPLLPLLPLPEPNTTLGAGLAVPSQLPTPGTERDESAPFDSIPQGHPAPPSDTPDHALPRIPGPSIPSLPRHQESSTSSSDVPPDSTPAFLTVTAPPSPSLSDAYIRAHPHERTTVDHPPDAGVPVIGTLVQPPNLSQMHSDAGVEGSSLVSPDPQPVTVPVLYEDTPAPVVATPPRLVVVNPTPGPTPHPTPPATPLSFLPGTDSRLRPHGQFLAPPSTRTVPQQLTPIQAPVFAKLDVGTPTLIGPALPVGGGSDLLPGQASLTPRLRPTPQGFASGKLRQQLGTQSTPTPTSAIQSTPPTQDPASIEGGRRHRVDEPLGSATTSQAPASHNPNRLSTSSTASTSSTGATTTTSDISSSSRLSMGATSINTDVSSGQQPSNAGSSDELKTLASLGLTEATLTSSPQHAEVASPVSPTSPRASTSVNSVKSTKSTVSTGTRAARRTGAPGLTRRASSGAASTGGGRSRKAGNLSTVNRATSNSSDSRSRSRDAVSRKSVAAAAGALAATMGMTTTSVAGPAGGARRKVGAKAVGKSRPGLMRTVSRGGAAGGVGLKRTLSHEDVEEVTDEDDVEEVAEAAAAAAAVREHEQRVKEEREREMLREAAEREAATREKERQVMSRPSKAKFKFGSNSDNGSNAGTEISSRAPGSEVYGVFDVKGKGRETEESLAAQERHAQELRERELAVQRAREAAAVLEREKQVKKEQARKEADAVARAKAQESLADPLLPQGTKRTILLTSESDYTDTDDDASWTSEDVDEGGAVEAPASRQQPPSARQSSHQESRHAQQNTQQHQPQQQQPPPHPPTVQRTHSTVSGAGRTTRRELQHIQQRREAQLRVQRAAAQLQREEERQREMFAKKPTRSFQNLTELQRTTSAGLLTQLMNPDPSIFPANHPYRRGHSSGEIQRMGMTPMMSMTSMASAVQPPPSRTRSQPLDQQQPAPLPQPQQRRRPVDERPLEAQPAPAPAPPVQQQPLQPPRQQQQNVARRPPPRRSVTLDSHMMPPPPPPATTSAAPENKEPTVPPSPVRSERRAPSVAGVAIGFALRGMRNLGFGSGKSTTAGPMASQVIAGSVSTKHVAKHPDAAPTSPDVRSPGSSTGYRPKGPLPGQEMETDSEDEVEENSVQLSKSIAQDRLKQFAARRGIVAAGPTLPTQPENEDIPAWAREEPNASAQTAAQQPAQAAGPAPAPGPIPMMHPYNLPVNAVPSTPRTTRRQMLRNEMSESLRRQLLWERQQAGVPIRRTTSTGHVGPQRNNTLNGLKPLTTTPSMVQLHAKGTVNRQLSNLRQEVQAGPSNSIRGSGDRERRASSRQSEGDQEARRQALARNRSWTNDYHTSGW